MNSTSNIDEILRELASKPIGIQGAFLASSEGQPITVPVGMDEDTALILAGAMLYLAQSTSEELQWETIEKISIQGNAGHVVLTQVTPDILLLVKAGKALTGLLDGEINRTVKKLRATLQVVEETTINITTSPEIADTDMAQLNTRLPASNHSEIRYRGRPVE